MKKFWTGFFLVLLGNMVLATLVSADLVDLSFDYGFYLRLRQEYIGNSVFLGTKPKEEDDFFRMKASFWGEWEICKQKNYTIFAKITTEPRYYLVSNKGDKYEKYTRDEIFFDNLYLDIKSVAGLPLNLRLGRQDFLGAFDDLLVVDGTPGDGSRSFYFNAIKATWQFNDKNSLDVIYVNDPHDDEYLPVIDKLGPPEKQLCSSNEDGIIFYERSKVNDKLSVEPYYIYKSEAKIGATPDLSINAFGLRAIYKVNAWNFRGEYAHEFGEYDGGQSREANGGCLFFSRKFNETRFAPEINAGFVYLSGDDRDSGVNEGWDPLFSRFSTLSELYVFTYAKEPGAGQAYWTNLQLYRAGVRLNFNPTTNLSLCCNYLLANESVTPGDCFSDGRERGCLYQGTLYHTFNKNIDGLLLAEYFVPGDFYVKSADPAVFLRWQLQFKF